MPEVDGRDNLATMALVEACYRSVDEHRAVRVDEMRVDDMRSDELRSDDARSDESAADDVP